MKARVCVTQTQGMLCVEEKVHLYFPKHFPVALWPFTPGISSGGCGVWEVRRCDGTCRQESELPPEFERIVEKFFRENRPFRVEISWGKSGTVEKVRSATMGIHF